MRYKTLLLFFGMLLSACAARTPPGACVSVSCRPDPDSRQMVIWWQTDMRPGAADFTRVNVP
ncbi:type III secretion lipoprotein [Dickeya chrysanthemi Ech1591]|uniref:Type III secretion lipoprotein n=1 Tax=Dickeya chrysanthemi (strain Ech1591) TaxID=561229 RepID=C6CGU5_DICC1|nr:MULTISPECIES: HrpT family type III secretion system protein [Dickeya]ACT06758.1 type III secretion lipoprotein [Dickeya chrysanthemi Ech1591]TYL41617.1 type III secretion protein HrpT [Dickeya sp. ws52]WJM84632.1 HrpT family type III secretion system protein [Dickeya chrysanthemi]